MRTLFWLKSFSCFGDRSFSWEDGNGVWMIISSSSENFL